MQCCASLTALRLTKDSDSEDGRGCGWLELSEKGERVREKVIQVILTLNRSFPKKCVLRSLGKRKLLLYDEQCIKRTVCNPPMKPNATSCTMEGGWITIPYQLAIRMVSGMTRSPPAYMGLSSQLYVFSRSSRGPEPTYANFPVRHTVIAFRHRNAHQRDVRIVNLFPRWREFFLRPPFFQLLFSSLDRITIYM